jgi:KDO2-lipid IV(A) lauroyltransferase
MLSYLLFRLAGLIAPHVPRRAAYALLRPIAVLLFWTNTGNRRMIRCNVRRVLGADASQNQVDRVTRRIFHSLLKNYFDLFWLPAQKLADVRPLVTVDGYQNVEQALSLGKGMIALSAHLGNPEIMSQVESVTDRNLTLIVEHMKNERVFNYVSSLRRSSGIRLVPQDGALREIFRALKRNEIVGLVSDRDVAGTGRVIPFFGAPARLPDGYAVLALKLGVPIVPSFIIRQPGDRYQACIGSPMVFEGRADNDDDVRRVMTSVNAVVEQYITQHIEQWIYFHYIWEDDKRPA